MSSRETGPDVRGTIQSILGTPVLGARATQEEIVQALAKAAAAVADAHDEVAHWRAAFGIIQTEMVMLASVLLKQRGKGRKLVVKSEDFKRIAETMQLVSTNPEPGVRVYELHKVRPKDAGKVLLQ